MHPRTSAYDFSFQLLECPHCDAPIKASLDGGQTVCEYCGSSLHVALRPRTAAIRVPQADATGEDRITWLRRQLADKRRRNPFDTDDNYLPELLDWKGRAWPIQQSFDELLPRLRTLWKKVLGDHAQRPDDEKNQFRLYWLADRMALFYEVFSAGAASGEFKSIAVDEANVKRRAVLETALARLSETKFAYVLRCKLSRAASRAGDLTSANEWLAACVATPDSPDLDSEYRLALGSLQIAQGEPELVVDTLGADLDSIPVSGVRNGRKAAALRAHAFELLGQHDRVGSFVSEASERFGMREMINELLIHDAAPLFRARSKRRFKRGCLAAVLTLPLVAGVVLLFVWALAETAQGSVQSAGGALGTWSVVVDECVSADTYDSSAPGAELSSSAYPQFRVRFAKGASQGMAILIGQGTTTILGPNQGAAQAWSLQVMTPTATTHVNPYACTRFGAEVDWNGTEMNGVDEVDGFIDADCPVAGGGRLVVNARFENCR
jgi:hypothetical protein